MRRFTSLVLALGLFGCPGPTPTDPTTCAEAPVDATIDAIHFTDGSGQILEDGDALPITFGGQGSAMAVFHVALEGPGVPGCAFISIDELGLARRPIELEPRAGLMVSGLMTLTGPGSTVALTASAYGREVSRTFTTDGEPIFPASIAEIALGGSAVPGASAEVRVTLDGPALRPRRVVLSADQDLGLGADEVRTIAIDDRETVFTITIPSTPGPLVLEVWIADRPEEIVRLETDVELPRTLGLRAAETEIALTPFGTRDVLVTLDDEAAPRDLVLRDDLGYVSGAIAAGETSGTLTTTVPSDVLGAYTVEVAVVGGDVLDVLSLTLVVVEPRSPAAGDLRVNEVLASPPEGVDLACDLLDDPLGDQFVEIVNVSNDSLDLNGVMIAGTAPIDEDIMLLPGASLVVFGSGSAGLDTFGPSSCRDLVDGRVGASVLLRRVLNLPLRGAWTVDISLGPVTIDHVDWGATVVGVSIQRVPDLMQPFSDVTPGSWLPHSVFAEGGEPLSPGRPATF